MNIISVFCSVSATLCLLWGYWLYNKGICAGKIKPNPVTWFLWAIGGIVEAGSYWQITSDPFKRLFPTVCALVIIFTFLLALFGGRFQRPARIDILILILDVEIGLLLFTNFRPEYVNALVQGDLMLTFAPLIRSTWQSPTDENSIPWLVWSLSYALLAMTVLMRFEDWWDLMYPAIQLALHLIVGLIARFRTAQP